MIHHGGAVFLLYDCSGGRSMKLCFVLPFLAAALFVSCVSRRDFDSSFTHRIAAYTVEDGRLVPEEPEEEDTSDVPPLSEPRRAVHRDIWERTRRIIPDQYEQYIKRFVIDSDGFGEVAAYVEPAEGENSLDFSSWTLGMDDVDSIDHMGHFLDEELDITLIHEFAHILSFNDSQADPADDLDDPGWVDTWDFSRQYRTSEAVLREDSYLNRFFLEFWGADQIYRWFDPDTGMNEINVRYHTDFVSDYAMTNPDEDFAESFLTFVMDSEIPRGDFISHRKVRFFYDFPELVKIRDEIRAVLPEEYNRPIID